MMPRRFRVNRLRRSASYVLEKPMSCGTITTRRSKKRGTEMLRKGNSVSSAANPRPELKRDSSSQSTFSHAEH
jgi:hypothetical protein